MDSISNAPEEAIEISDDGSAEDLETIAADFASIGPSDNPDVS